MDVAIIGAGVLGVSLAYHLSNKNLEVCVIEREAVPAAHASGKNAGMFRQLYRHPQLTNWAMRSRQMWSDQIRAKYFVETGSVITARTMPNHHNQLFNQIKIAGTPAIYTASDGLIDSSCYVQHLAAQAKSSGVNFLYNTELLKLSHGMDTWLLECSKGISISTPLVVNAAGAWINNFLKPHCPQLQKKASAYARHLFVVQGWQKDFMPVENCGYYWDEQNAWYMRQWDETARLVSICDYQKTTPETFLANPEVQFWLAEKLQKALPEQYQTLNVARSWHCFRTYTDDQIPIWGEDPDAPGLFWLAAFGGFGISTSFAASYDAAQYILSGSSAVSKDFSPERSGLRGETELDRRDIRKSANQN